MLNRLVLLLSLVGMVLALHLWVQKERNFDQGCWGVGASGAATLSTGGCTNTTLQKASELAGVSVAAWGYGFYLLIAGLAFAKTLLPEKSARACHAGSEVAVLLAFPFTCYLFYVQAFIAKAFCPLCLVSGGIVTALFAIHVVVYLHGGYKPIAEGDRVKEIGYASGMVFLATAGLAALMIMVNQIGTRRFDEGENAQQFVAMVGRSLPKFIEIDRLREMKPALLNHERPPLNLSDWLQDTPPVLGTREGVSVVVFLDPNCGSCVAEYATILTLAERHRGRAGFYVFSRILWDRSLLQTQALELAAEEGKYFEMWKLQFMRRQHDGLGLPEIVEMLHELGVSSENLERRLEAVKPVVLARREKAEAAGIRSTPTVFIDGIAVDGSSRDEVSMSKLIDRAFAARQSGQDSSSSAAAATIAAP